MKTLKKSKVGSFLKFPVRGKIYPSAVFLAGFLAIFALFHPGLPWTHDGQDQVARIANFYQNLTEGNFIPRWAANLNWGYGHPILEFLYPLPSYIASFFHLLGFSLIDSAKIVFGLGMIASGLFMYLWLKEFLGREAAFLGGILYMFAPYRFVDLYVRGDIGENLAFAFMPLTLNFIYRLYKSGDLKFIPLGGLSLSFLILSHNAVALMFIPFIISYGFYLLCLTGSRKSLIINFLSLIILGFSLSAFFWLPGLLEGKYTLRNIVTAGGYLGRFVKLKDLLYGPWSYGGSGQFTVQLGIFQWLAFLSSPFIVFYLIKRKDKNYLFVLGLVIYTLIAVFLMLSQSNFIWARLMLLQNFQFPWRFLTVTVFSTSVLGAFLTEVVSEKIGVRKAAVLLILAILAILFLSSAYLEPKGYLYKSDSFFSGIYHGTTDTGESAPVWSVRFMEHYPEAPIQIISGTGKVRELVRKTTYRLYSFSSVGSARVLVNILYFPGWNIYIDGKPAALQFQDPKYRGLMTFYVPSGNHKIEAVFSETKLRETADIISLMSLISIAGFILLRVLNPALLNLKSKKSYQRK